MKTTVKLTICLPEARKEFPGLGVPNGDSVVNVELDIHSDLCQRILKKDRRYWRRGRLFVSSWEFVRHYSPEELDSSNYFVIWPSKTVGTCLEDKDATMLEVCPMCHRSDRKDLTTMRGRIHCQRPVFGTYAAECLLYQATWSEFLQSGIAAPADAQSLPIRGQSELVYFEPVRRCRMADVTDIRDGIEVDKPRPLSRCGHYAGLNRMSELFIVRDSFEPGAHFWGTFPYIGGESGMLRPMPEIVCDRIAFDWLAERGYLKWFRYEIVRLV